jgi:protein-L-isoaspartate(D-aspartate) O-methyltransferase
MAASGDRPGYTTFVNRLADELVAKGAITTAPVEQAFRTVPRHLFIDRGEVYVPEEQKLREVLCDHESPDADVLDAIYRDAPVSLSPGSLSSQPMCMAWMLEDLQLRPGMRVCEIGTASGWNAALLAKIVGDPSLVYSIEVDAELAQSAKRHLEESGYGGVTVVTSDGAKGHAPGAPYDAIIVTCGCTDLAPTWVEQLAEGGAILVPLHVAPSGDPTLLVRRSAEGLRGRFTRWIWFVECRSEVMPESVLPEAISGEEALALGSQVDEVDFPQSDEVFADYSDRRCSFFLFLSMQMTPHDRLVTWEHARPAGMAYPAAGEACVFSAEGRIQVIGGTTQLQRLLGIAERWEALGRPVIRDFAVTVVPAGTVTEVPPTGGILRRRHYDYIVSVSAR